MTTTKTSGTKKTKSGGLKVKTLLKAGGIGGNHNRTIAG
jgi:hypothetical protein